jgi:predicted RNase H-like HicB family nuclease
MKYHFKVAKDENGYTARCIELFGCYASGYNKKSLHRNMKEALDSYIEKGELCPLPNQDLYGYEEIEPDQALAMGLLLRHAGRPADYPPGRCPPNSASGVRRPTVGWKSKPEQPMKNSISCKDFSQTSIFCDWLYKALQIY